jgi:hypothetical protein
MEVEKRSYSIGEPAGAGKACHVNVKVVAIVTAFNRPSPSVLDFFIRTSQIQESWFGGNADSIDLLSPSQPRTQAGQITLFNSITLSNKLANVFAKPRRPAPMASLHCSEMLILEIIRTGKSATS